MSGHFQLIFVVATFVAVVGLIAFDLVDLSLAAMGGVILCHLAGLLDEDDILATIDHGGGTIALLFGGMVVARVLVPTGIFEWLGERLILFSGGSGRRLAIGMVLLAAPLCAILPNATVVLLLAPVIIRAATALKIGFVPLLIVLVAVSNAAGLLTLIGDPATFIVGSSIGMSFNEYLQKVSLGGLLTVLTIFPLMPWLLKEAWRTQRPPITEREACILRPGFAFLALAAFVVMTALFVLGEHLPRRIDPPAVAILGATLMLLIIYSLRIEPVDRVLADVDWRTLIFIFSMLVMVRALVRTGALTTISSVVASVFGSHTTAAAMALLAGVGFLSAFLANTPVVVALVVVTKGYLVEVGVVPDVALSQHGFDWPDATLPVFMGMMFGATLGGNATLIGASANVVASGISSRHGEPLSFGRFARIGAPIALAQLAVGSIYVLVRASAG